MNVVFFCHSLLSDWNHGNAHFLRGVAGELHRRGHHVTVFEPYDAWSVKGLIAESGERALAATRRAYPTLQIVRYDPDTIDLSAVLRLADVVIVHEWNSHALVRSIGERRSDGDFVLLFHDTHHRSVTDPAAMAAYDLSRYDGVLAFGDVIRRRYVANGWAARAWTWHEAADTEVFSPQAPSGARRDLVWIGNWGDGERTAELHEFLIDPVADLQLRTAVHGVRYPESARAALRDAGIWYHGWLANYLVPHAFACHRVTVHVPRRPYVEMLPGIPTIRPFEALACGIPLVSAPWDDIEGLFRRGTDYLVARDGVEMRRRLRAVLNDPDLACSLAEHGRETILARHTCGHRVDELLAICAALKPVAVETMLA